MMIDYPREDQIPELRQLWKTVFQDDDVFLDPFFSLAFEPGRCLCALEGNAIVGALYWLPCRRGEDKFAYLYAVATHPEHRGRGVCRSLMAAAHAVLEKEGYAGALLYPQEEGLREMYRKMGYENATWIGEGICAMGTAPISMHAITAEEYARIRPDFLPENSVLQESPFLELLDQSFRFYKGLGFLLAAQQREDHLYGAELLGNPQAMPGILCALGIPWARFRTPGRKLPFAMFRQLLPGTLPPSYFAFALE